MFRTFDISAMLWFTNAKMIYELALKECRTTLRKNKAARNYCKNNIIRNIKVINIKEAFIFSWTGSCYRLHESGLAYAEVENFPRAYVCVCVFFWVCVCESATSRSRSPTFDLCKFRALRSLAESRVARPYLSIFVC